MYVTTFDHDIILATEVRVFLDYIQPCYNIFIINQKQISMLIRITVFPYLSLLRFFIEYCIKSTNGKTVDTSR